MDDPQVNVPYQILLVLSIPQGYSKRKNWIEILPNPRENIEKSPPLIL